MRYTVLLLACVVWWLVLVGDLAAQTAFEFGLDAGVRAGANGTDVDIVSVSVPNTLFRFGAHFAERFSVEPTIGLSHTETEGDIALTNLETSVALLYHFSSNRQRPRVYIMAGIPFVFTRIADQTDSFSDSTFGVLGGLGLSLPLTSRIAIRVHGRGDALFTSRSAFWGLVGFSFFTR